MVNYKNKTMILAVVLGLLLTGCGGSSGDGGTQAPSNSLTETVGSGGGNVILPDKTLVTVDPGVLKDGAQVTVSTSPSPLIPIPAEVDTVSPSVRVEFPANALQDESSLNKGITIEIPLPEGTNGKMQAPSLQDVNKQFKVVGVRISRGAKILQGWAKYTVKQGNKVAVWVGSQYLDIINTAGEGGGIIINAGVQFTKKCFQGLEFNKLYHAIRPFNNQVLSPEIYSDKDSPNYNSVINPNQNKIPLVLVHGIQLIGIETCTDAYKKTWATFLAHFYNDPELSSRYQVFTFSYDTSTAIRDEDTGEGSGKSFAQKLSEVTQFHNAIVITHSMGGLVARSAMVHDAAPVDHLITLATPHHGTVLRKVDEILVKKSLTAPKVLIAEGAWFLFLGVNGARQLDWDNFDGKLASCNILPGKTCNRFVKGLNEIDSSLSRYTLFGGDISDPLVKIAYEELSFPEGEGDSIVPKVSAFFQDFNETLSPPYRNKPALGDRLNTFPVSHTSIHSNPEWPNPSPGLNTVFGAVKAKLFEMHTLTVTKNGTGSGTVVSTDGSIHCGVTCQAPFNSVTEANLTATSDAGSSFAGWTGGGCSGTGTCTLTMNADIAVTALFNLDTPILPSGSLDPTFGTGGKVTTDFGSDLDWAKAITIQVDGKIVVAGHTQSNISKHFALARYNPDGTLDPTFGTGGKVITDFTTGSNSTSEALEALVIQADGKIVAAGGGPSSFVDDDFAVSRYNPDGTLDTTFGEGGKVTTNFNMTTWGGFLGGTIDVANALAIQANGKIVAAGRTQSGIQRNFALTRYNPDGTLDLTFGTGGKVITDFGGTNSDNRARAIVIQSDGKIVVAGLAFGAVGGLSTHFALARYNPDGTLDSTFGTEGKVTTDFGGSTGNDPDEADALVIQADGKIVAAGFAANSVNRSFALARYNPDGTLDPTFGTGGKVTTSFGTSKFNKAKALVILADGKILAVGNARSNAFDVNGDFALARYNPDGTLDSTFGTEGKVTTNFGMGGYNGSNALVIQMDGKIVAAGLASDASGKSDFALSRYLP